MVDPLWLTRIMIEVLHTDQIAEHGGSPGIRDEGLLESALARPRDEWGYDPRTDVATLAAAHGFEVARNHPFIDGGLPEGDHLPGSRFRRRDLPCSVLTAPPLPLLHSWRRTSSSRRGIEKDEVGACDENETRCVRILLLAVSFLDRPLHTLQIGWEAWRGLPPISGEGRQPLEGAVESHSEQCGQARKIPWSDCGCRDEGGKSCRTAKTGEPGRDPLTNRDGLERARSQLGQRLNEGPGLDSGFASGSLKVLHGNRGAILGVEFDRTGQEPVHFILGQPTSLIEAVSLIFHITLSARIVVDTCLDVHDATVRHVMAPR